MRPLVGLVPQEVSLYPELTAQENLRFFGRINGVGGEELGGRVDELLARVSLVARRRDRVATFTGGMKRRLNLACSLIHRPRLLRLGVASGLEEEKQRALAAGSLADIAQRLGCPLQSTDCTLDRFPRTLASDLGEEAPERLGAFHQSREVAQEDASRVNSEREALEEAQLDELADVGGVGQCRG